MSPGRQESPVPHIKHARLSQKPWAGCALNLSERSLSVVTLKISIVQISIVTLKLNLRERSLALKAVMSERLAAAATAR